MKSGYQLVPRAAYRYWPSDNEAIKGTGRFALRLIFERQAYTDTEESALEELRRLTDSNQSLSVQASRLQRADWLRLIYACGWDLPATIQRLAAYLTWVDETLTGIRGMGSPRFEQVFNSGGMYTDGRDCYYRPLVYITPCKLAQILASEHGLETCIQAAIFMFDFILREMCLPGQVENWVVLLDLNDSPALNLEEMRRVISMIQLGFPCRLAAGYIRNSTRLWMKITALLTPETSGKFTILSEDCRELWEVVNRTQVERKWGGLRPDKETYWPPSLSPKDISAAGYAPQPSDYSSRQEYFPEQSLTEGEVTEVVKETIWTESDQGSWEDAKDVLFSEGIEFEERLRTCRKPNEPQTLLKHKQRHRLELPLTPPLKIESNERLTAACCCLTKRHTPSCSLM